jgi:hypothetical protein
MSLWLVSELAEAHGGSVTAARDGNAPAYTVMLEPRRP